jgi:hypothetical protein
VSSNHVRPPVPKLTDADARHLLAEGLVRVCHAKGPSRVAVEIGCDEKTVRRARDEDSTLGLACFGNLVSYEPDAVRPFFAALRKRLVDLDGEDIADLSLPCIVNRFSLELSLALEDGRLDNSELLKMRPQIEALGEAIDGLRERLKVRAA